jgi:DNA-binding transcriptional LysR family regulator
VLTVEGEKIAALAERMAETSRAVERLAQGARSDIDGEVTISAPPAYAAWVLARRLVPLCRRHPALCLRLLGEAHQASLERREADIAIRLHRPDSGDLTAMRIGTMAFHLYASPGYIATIPEAEWTFIGSAGVMAGSLQQAALASAAADQPLALHSDSVDIQAALAAAGRHCRLARLSGRRAQRSGPGQSPRAACHAGNLDGGAHGYEKCRAHPRGLGCLARRWGRMLSQSGLKGDLNRYRVLMDRWSRLMGHFERS